MSGKETDNYMNAVAEVATLAGNVARRYYGKSPEARLKKDGSPVSAADFDAERAAREWIEKKFPADGIIGEELPPTRESAKRRWILDPIDGTFTFLQNVPLWGTLVAVVEGENVIAGAAYFPALERPSSPRPAKAPGGMAHAPPCRKCRSSSQRGSSPPTRGSIAIQLGGTVGSSCRTARRRCGRGEIATGICSSPRVAPT